MALVSANKLTLVDAAKRRDPDGSMAMIAEMLQQTNTVIEDGVYVEANGELIHRTTYRTGLPSGTWRPVNKGIQPSKSTSAQATEIMSMLDDLSIIDTRILRWQRDADAFRASEDMAFIMGFAQEMAAQAFYGTATPAAPEEGFLGLHQRFNDSTANNARNIRDHGDALTLTSAYITTWGEQTCHFIHPPNTPAGIEIDVMPVDLVNDDQTPAGQYRAARTYFSWTMGMCVRDWRYCGRVANINANGLDDSSTATLIQELIEVRTMIQDGRYGSPVCYLNRELKGKIDGYAQRKGNVYLSMGEWAGQPTTMLQDMPLRVNDAIANDEPVYA